VKLKGVNPFEQHADKIVMGLFVLFLLCVVVVQAGLIGGTRTVKVGSRDVPIDKADEAVREQAIARKARLDSEQVNPSVPTSLPKVEERFQAAMSGDDVLKLPPSALAMIGVPGMLEGGVSGAILPTGIGGDAEYSPVTPPAPSRPMAAVHEGTVDPIEVARIGPDLAKWLPKAQPFDARIVSVQTGFDAARLRSMFNEPRDGATPIPAALWQGRVEILDVEWLRQERQPDGSWSEPVTIDPMPGRFSLRSMIRKTDFQLAELRDLLNGERDHRLEVRRPEFYPTISGESWVWPAKDVVPETSTVPGQAEIDRLVRELQEVRREIANIEKQLNKGAPGGQGGDPRRPPAPPPPRSDRRSPSWPDEDTTPRHADAGPQDPCGETEFVWPVFPREYVAQFGGGGGRDGEEEKKDTKGEREAKARELLTKRLEVRKAREKEILDELAKRGVNDAGRRAEAGPAGQFNEPLLSLGEPDSNNVTLWAHDITVRPDATYRYKARVWLTNPFFGQPDRLMQEHRAAAERPAIASEDSEWSTPIHVEPQTVYFVASAVAAGSGPLGGESRASVELYEFFYGYWRRADVQVVAGDPLVSSVQLPPDAETFLIERDNEGRWLVADKQPLERARRVVIDGFFLDAAPVVGAEAGRTQVYIHENGGVAIRPAGGLAEQTQAYRRLATSFEQSKSAVIRLPGTSEPAGAPQAPPVDDGGGGDRDRPKPPPRNPNDPPALPKDRGF